MSKLEELGDKVLFTVLKSKRHSSEDSARYFCCLRASEWIVAKLEVLRIKQIRSHHKEVHVICRLPGKSDVE